MGADDEKVITWSHSKRRKIFWESSVLVHELSVIPWFILFLFFDKKSSCYPERFSSVHVTEILKSFRGLTPRPPTLKLATLLRSVDPPH